MESAIPTYWAPARIISIFIRQPPCVLARVTLTDRGYPASPFIRMRSGSKPGDTSTITCTGASPQDPVPMSKSVVQHQGLNPVHSYYETLTWAAPSRSHRWAQL